MLRRFALLAAVIGSSGFLFALDGEGPTSMSTPLVIPAADAPAPVDLPGLHNVVTYDLRLISGGVPEGEAAFASLAAMGVKTILSVDGALPEIELARKHGLRYVHLPIGYNGMDETRLAEIARAVRDLPQPIYLHCHHGKHRSAGAAASAAVLLGWMTEQQGLSRMHVSGTASNYKGLFDAVTAAAQCEREIVDEASDEFPAQWLPSDFVEAMVEIDEATDNLKKIEKARWAAPANHPDLVPAAEAGRLADHFRLVLADPVVLAADPDMRKRFEADLKLLTEIEDGIVANMPPEELSGRFKLVLQSCKDCHTAHRDAETPTKRTH